VNAAPRPRDAERSRRAILEAALAEFSDHGEDGARIDRVAARAGLSKPLIYAYFGDKRALYAAALREAYVQIREGERALRLDDLPPEQAVRTLVDFTLEHFRRNPWFIRMLNTENLRGGGAIRDMKDLPELHSPLVGGLRRILERGAAAGVFRPGMDPVQLYLSIAGLFYFPISNAHTLGVVFGARVEDEDWLRARRDHVREMIARYLKPEA
jgi:AcrR family transcriptional regulator